MVRDERSTRDQRLDIDKRCYLNDTLPGGSLLDQLTAREAVWTLNRLLSSLLNGRMMPAYDSQRLRRR
jgi:hypothetical protein